MQTSTAFAVVDSGRINKFTKWSLYKSDFPFMLLGNILPLFRSLLSDIVAANQGKSILIAAFWVMAPVWMNRAQEWSFLLLKCSAAFHTYSVKSPFPLLVYARSDLMYGVALESVIPMELIKISSSGYTVATS